MEMVKGLQGPTCIRLTGVKKLDLEGLGPIISMAVKVQKYTMSRPSINVVRLRYEHSRSQNFNHKITERGSTINQSIPNTNHESLGMHRRRRRQFHIRNT